MSSTDARAAFDLKATKITKPATAYQTEHLRTKLSPRKKDSLKQGVNFVTVTQRRMGQSQ